METNMGKSVNDLLASITPLEQAKVDVKMLVAAKIADAMTTKNWKHKDLLEAMNKDTPSIITKWLSGTHNFTIDTLVELESALNVKFLSLADPRNKIMAKFHVEAKGEVQRGMGNVYSEEIIKPAYCYEYSGSVYGSNALID